MRRTLPALPALTVLALACGPGPNVTPAVTTPQAAPLPPLTVAYAPRGLATVRGATLAKTTEGGIVAWGEGWRSPLPKALAVAGQTPLAGVVELGAFDRGGCARLASGEVRCFDHPAYDGKPPKPFVIPGLRADAIAGSDQICAREAGAVRCFRAYASIEAKDVKPVEGVSGALDLAVGDDFGCAIVADGAVTCWGRSERGQTGATPPKPPEPPAQLDPNWTKAQPVHGISRARSIAAGAAHACAILEDGTVACWGAQGAGELTGEVGPDSGKPLAVPGVAKAKALALGAHHGCALAEGGKVTCWGANYRGQSAPHLRGYAARPAEIPGLDGVTEIAAGPEHTCARKGDGTIVCWGDDREGQLGVGDRSPRRGLVVAGKKPVEPSKPADPACPEGRVRIADWDAWAGQLQDAKEEQARSELLARVGLAPFPGDDMNGLERACLHTFDAAGSGAGVQDVQLVDGGAPWKLIEVGYRVCAPEPDPEESGRVDGMMRAVAHQVLRPLGNGEYCPVSGAFETLGFFSVIGCQLAVPHDAQPGQITLVDLVSAKHKTLQFDRSTGSCLMFRLGEAESTQSFHDVVEGPKGPFLARVFSATTLTAGRALTQYSQVETVKLTIGKGAFPRTITAEAETSCEGVDPQAGCKPQKSKTVHVFRGGEYVDPKAKRAPAPPVKAKKPAKKR